MARVPNGPLAVASLLQSTHAFAGTNHRSDGSSALSGQHRTAFARGLTACSPYLSAQADSRYPCSSPPALTSGESCRWLAPFYLSFPVAWPRPAKVAGRRRFARPLPPREISNSEMRQPARPCERAAAKAPRKETLFTGCDEPVSGLFSRRGIFRSWDRRKSLKETNHQLSA